MGNPLKTIDGKDEMYLYYPNNSGSYEHGYEIIQAFGRTGENTVLTVMYLQRGNLKDFMEYRIVEKLRPVPIQNFDKIHIETLGVHTVRHLYFSERLNKYKVSLIDVKTNARRQEDLDTIIEEGLFKDEHKITLL